MGGLAALLGDRTAAAGAPGPETAIGEIGVDAETNARRAEFLTCGAGGLNFVQVTSQIPIDLGGIEGFAAKTALFGGEFDGFGAVGALLGLLVQDLFGSKGRECGGGRGWLDFGDDKGEDEAEGAQENPEEEPAQSTAAFIGGDDGRGDAEEEPKQENHAILLLN